MKMIGDTLKIQDNSAWCKTFSERLLWKRVPKAAFLQLQVGVGERLPQQEGSAGGYPSRGAGVWGQAVGLAGPHQFSGPFAGRPGRDHHTYALLLLPPVWVWSICSSCCPKGRCTVCLLKYKYFAWRFSCICRTHGGQTRACSPEECSVAQAQPLSGLQVRRDPNQVGKEKLETVVSTKPSRGAYWRNPAPRNRPSRRRVPQPRQQVAGPGRAGRLFRPSPQRRPLPEGLPRGGAGRAGTGGYRGNRSAMARPGPARWGTLRGGPGRGRRPAGSPRGSAEIGRPWARSKHLRSFFVFR